MAGDVTLITQADDLQQMVDKLSTASILAVDTESNSLHAYREQVCLIQFSTTEADYLVDPLALQDLSALSRLFEAERIEKVFHAAEYDLLCLHRDFGMAVCHLFDTMIAARILGRSEIGLGALLEAELGVKLDKRFQRANWGQRPLPEDLIDYARLDTHYLIALRDRLEAELAERGLLKLAEEDFVLAARKASANHSAKRNGANGEETERGVDCWRISGAYDLPAQQAAVLMELCRYRDEVARKLDRPLFKVFGDQTLLSIASELPKNLEQLGSLPGMSLNQVRRHGRKLLRVVQRGLQAPPVFPTRQRRPDEGFTERLEALRTWRKNLAAEIGVGSDVILPRELMISLAEKGPQDEIQLAEALEAAPWRLEHFGDLILDVLRSPRKERSEQ
jgi:ribonuclease D